ncbi:hypothetical protein [Paenibacillus sabinae]|uniref:Uncharacterized protein n=1 Tax=Paenibacillus sabinae T27 TaxID=1268072 RepID=X5A3C7_9BACL|nr:hypothetical protein [Paenibacillus sabinae]AHV98808.1 hypothetical protein PSAB_19575 [Paenibacillus sabinae T27]
MKQGKLLFISTLIVMVLIFLPVSRYGASNLWGIIKLQTTDKDMIKTDENQNYATFMAKNIKGNGYENLKDYMKDKGWKYEEQIGSGFKFIKDNYETTVSTQQITKNYIQIKIKTEVD